MDIDERLQAFQDKFENAHQRHLQNLVGKQILANAYSQIGSNAKVKKELDHKGEENAK